MRHDPNYTAIGLPRPTPAVGRLLLINFVVFAVNFVLGGRFSDGGGEEGGSWFVVSLERLVDGYGLGVLRLLTYQFTHSYFEPWHFLGNMLVLYFIGPIAEDRIGYRGTWKLYVTGGLAGAFGHMLVYGAMFGFARDIPVVGASGSCFAVLMYAVCVAPRLQIIFFFFRVQLIFVGILFGGIALYMTVLELREGVKDCVSHSAHLGGALWSIAVWRLDWFRGRDAWGGEEPWLAGLRKRWRKSRAAAAAQKAEQRALQLDEILGKVKERGIGALSPAERRFLERASSDAKKK